MRFFFVTAVVACITMVSAKITYTLQKESNPTDDQRDAYARIEEAMDKAVARYNRLTNAEKTITVTYDTSTPTAKGGYSGKMSFGKNRIYMMERTALHEISHTLGVGQTDAFDTLCQAKDWITALPMLRDWDGAGAEIKCFGSHFSPYGMNYNAEWSEENADRHCKIVQAMLDDGM